MNKDLRDSKQTEDTQRPLLIAFKPLEQLKNRVANARDESDLALFHALLLYGEALTKCTVAGLVASVVDDVDRNRYRCPELERSISLVQENLCLFNRSWAYLYRNLSGKYRVTSLGGAEEPFSKFKTAKSEHVPNGIYVHFDTAGRVDLMESSPEALDFFIANGGFAQRMPLSSSFRTHLHQW